MIKLILLGPPGSGKGTQAKMISEEYKIPHISTGNILRQMGNQDGELATGFLFDDKFVNEIVDRRLKESDCSNGYILDGYPRNINQAMMHGNNLEIVFLLNIALNDAVSRLINRTICSNCYTSHNDTYSTLVPLVPGVCNKCKGKLIKRIDDNPDTIKIRFNEYIAKTAPLIAYYKKEGHLYEIDSSINPNHTFAQIKTIIDNYYELIVEK